METQRMPLWFLCAGMHQHTFINHCASMHETTELNVQHTAREREQENNTPSCILRSRIRIGRRGLYRREEKLCVLLIKVCARQQQSLFIYAAFTSAIYHGARQIKRKCARQPKRFAKFRSLLKYVTQTDPIHTVGPNATRASESVCTK